jgi:hypothetical protein
MEAEHSLTMVRPRLADEPASTRPRRFSRRRIGQFSLRGLLLLLTVCGVVLGIAAQRARSERTARETILALDGRIEIEARPYASLLAKLGVPTEYASDAVHVSLWCEDVTEAMPALQGLRGLRTVQVEFDAWRLEDRDLKGALATLEAKLPSVAIEVWDVTPTACE